MPLPAKYNWIPVRDAFVTEEVRPTYEELATRFNVPVGTLGRVCSDQSWPDLRVKYQLEIINKSDALAVITAASKDSTVLSGMAFEALAQIISGILRALSDLDKDAEIKPRGRMDILNTATFAMQNASNAARGFGITNLPEALKRAASGLPGAPGNGTWDKQLLQQINVTVNGLQEAKSKASAEPGSVDAQANVVKD